MSALFFILPGTGRWQSAGLTEGPLSVAPKLSVQIYPYSLFRTRPLHHFVVPLPVPGRI